MQDRPNARSCCVTHLPAPLHTSLSPAAPIKRQLALYTKTATMTKRVYFVVHGTVQGVGFRYFTRKKAQEYGVTGWCRNTRDNTVEGEAQATEDILTKFLKDVDYGPRHARVTKVVKEDREIVEGEDSFDVTR